MASYNEVVELYVATFNRAPDSAGLDYWVYDSGLSLTQIAKSFFVQSETQSKYPSSMSNRDFIAEVYNNLFNREPDSAGWDYWEDSLNAGNVTKDNFILAMINGAKAPTGSIHDLATLSNKTEVGLAFAQAGLQDTSFSLASVTNNPATKSQMLDYVNELASYLDWDDEDDFYWDDEDDYSSGFDYSDYMKYEHCLDKYEHIEYVYSYEELDQLLAQMESDCGSDFMDLVYTMYL